MPKPSQVVHKRKLSGSVFLSLRIIADLIIFSFCANEILSHRLLINWVFMLTIIADVFFCSAFLLFPFLTCKGNTYLTCLPFLLNSYISNILVFSVEFPGLYTEKDKQFRITFIAMANIITLIFYGGLACPLNLAWMETFKPFSSIIMVNRKFSMKPQGVENDQIGSKK